MKFWHQLVAAYRLFVENRQFRATERAQRHKWDVEHSAYWRL